MIRGESISFQGEGEGGLEEPSGLLRAAPFWAFRNMALNV